MRICFYAGAALLMIGMSGIAMAQDAWNPKTAAAYLDERSGWWMAWPGAARDHGTFCVSCHTLAPYALSRPYLRTALGETGPSVNERKMLDNMVTRVRMWKEAEPFYPDQTRGLPKTSESRGTEAILNALVLAATDSPKGKLSADARLALENMWALQLRSGEMNGSWAWLQFHNAPWEGDSQFYGTALAAVAVGSAPGDYQAEPGIQAGVKAMREWLQKNLDAQTQADQVVALWASAKLRGLLSGEQQKKVLAGTLAKQRADGSFSIGEMVGNWKRRDKTAFDEHGDGYATGLVALALKELKAPDAEPSLQRALAWLGHNQNAADGRWPASSLNKKREVSSEAGLFMSDAATAYAVMALGIK